METLDVVEFICIRPGTAEDDLVRETGGPMFLIEVLALRSLLYWNRLAHEVRLHSKSDYGTLVHVANILEVDVAAFIWEEIHLIRLVDILAKWFVTVECLLAHMSPETQPAYEASVSVVR